MIRRIYNKLLSPERRFWLYKQRHKHDIAALRSVTHPSPKGDFSLKPFDEKQAIFVHITKSAGTSVALSLFGKLPYHYRAWEYRVIFGRQDFEKYFKFAFVRNPWDRLYSAFSFLKGGGWNEDDKKWADENLSDITDFNDFVLNWLTPERLYSYIHFWPQSDFICDRKNNPMIDFLGYFESISDDFKYIAQRINSSGSLKHTNASKRLGYTSIYSDDAIDKVAKLYATDIKNFGYTFDGINRKQIKNGSFVDERD